MNNARVCATIAAMVAALSSVLLCATLAAESPAPAPVASPARGERVRRRVLQFGGGYTYQRNSTIDLIMGVPTEPLSMHGGSWSVAAFAHWSRKSAQLSLGSGLRGYHVSGRNPQYDPAYIFPQTEVAVAHTLMVPLELRAGLGALDEWFLYGMFGVELGVAIVQDWGGVGMLFAYNPVKLGVGGYADVGRGFLIGAEAQTDILGVATANGLQLDLQLKLGYRFTLARARR